MTKLRDYIKAANSAHTDLCLFDTIRPMVEGGGFSPGSQADQFVIVKACNRATQKCLDRYDRAMARAGAPYPERKRTP